MIEIKIRLAVPDDCKQMFEWRNAEETRQYFMDPNPLLWENHRTWFQSVLSDKNRHLLIGEEDKQPIGVLRYDVEESKAYIDMYLRPGMSGKKRGTALFIAGNKWVKENVPAVQQIQANVIPQNIACIRALIKADFKEEYYVLKHYI